MINKFILKTTTAVIITTLGLGTFQASVLADSWTFKVRNIGNSKILRIEAAEIDSNEWGAFDDSAINTGEEITLEWDSSTDNSYCVWKLRAIYADGPSETANFDFCEETEIEFDN